MGDAYETERLLFNGADPNIGDKPIITAAAGRILECIKALIRHGTHVNATSSRVKRRYIRHVSIITIKQS